MCLPPLGSSGAPTARTALLVSPAAAAGAAEDDVSNPPRPRLFRSAGVATEEGAEAVAPHVAQNHSEKISILNTYFGIGFISCQFILFQVGGV